MHAGTIDFDQVERRTGRTRAVVVYSRNVRWIVLPALLMLLNHCLRSIIRSYANLGRVEAFTDEQVRKAIESLSELHEDLTRFLGLNNLCILKRKPLMGKLLSEIEECSEDLSEIIEDLLLSRNEDFKALVGACVESVKHSKATGALVGTV